MKVLQKFAQMSLYMTLQYSKFMHSIQPGFSKKQIPNTVLH